MAKVEWGKKETAVIGSCTHQRRSNRSSPWHGLGRSHDDIHVCEETARILTAVWTVSTLHSATKCGQSCQNASEQGHCRTAVGNRRSTGRQADIVQAARVTTVGQIGFDI